MIDCNINIYQKSYIKSLGIDDIIFDIIRLETTDLKTIVEVMNIFYFKYL